MTVITTYNMTHQQYEDQATRILKMVVAHLFESDLISEKTYSDYMKNVSIIVRKPSFFHQFWNKIKRYKGDESCYIIIRQMNLVESENPNDGQNHNLKVVKFEKKNDESEKEKE